MIPVSLNISKFHKYICIYKYTYTHTDIDMYGYVYMCIYISPKYSKCIYYIYICLLNILKSPNDLILRSHDFELT